MPSITYLHHRKINGDLLEVSPDKAGFQGIIFFIYQALKRNFSQCRIVSGVFSIPSVGCLMRMLCNRWSKNQYRFWADITLAKNYARQFSYYLKNNKTDCALVTQAKYLSFLKCSQFKVAWLDGLHSQIDLNYPGGSLLSRYTIQNLKELDRLAVQNADLLVFASQWAATYAINEMKADKRKVCVIPWGANLDSKNTRSSIKMMINQKKRDICNLLFCGVHWKRKGGDIAIRIIEYLNHKEFPVQLFLIGVEPPQSLPIPNNVIKVGYINKMISGSRILSDYYEKSHFLLLPTRAEAFGIVLCEANSCGLPCIQRTWGGLRRL